MRCIAHSPLHGIFGLRHFTALGIRKFIVNSRTAAELVERDLGSHAAAGL